jgi:hypothetical protein
MNADCLSGTAARAHDAERFEADPGLALVRRCGNEELGEIGSRLSDGHTFGDGMHYGLHEKLRTASYQTFVSHDLYSGRTDGADFQLTDHSSDLPVRLGKRNGGSGTGTGPFCGPVPHRWNLVDPAHGSGLARPDGLYQGPGSGFQPERLRRLDRHV